MKRVLSFLLAGFLLLGAAWAQTTVTGKVLDPSGDPLEGVTVLIKGTTSGAFTDAEGNFKLQVPEGSETLIFTMVGRATIEEAIAGSSMTVTMSAQDVTLDEVVVTALGLSRDKKSLGYATQEVSGDEVTRVKDANFVNSLSGKVAGIDIKRSGVLGGSSNVVIRGYTSLTGNNQALFVVDGIPISNSNTNSTTQQRGYGGYDYGNFAMDINPEDIESINVLKGAAATALYGSRAARGVIQITTKRGRKRKGLGVRVSTGLTLGQIDQSTFPKYQFEYGPGYGAFYGSGPGGYFEEYTIDGTTALAVPVGEDASMGAAYDPSINVFDWRSVYPELDTYGQTFPYQPSGNGPLDFFQTSQAWNTNVSIEGGNNDGNFRLSYTNFNSSGVIPNANLDRNTLSLASALKLNSKIKVSSTLNYILTENDGLYGTGYDSRNPNQAFRQWYQTGVSMEEQRLAYEQTGLNLTWNPFNAGNTNPHYFDNPYFVRYENFATNLRNRFFGNVQMDIDLTDWLHFLGRLSTDRSNSLQEERTAIGSVETPSYNRYNRIFSEDNLDLILSVDKFFGANDEFNFNGLVGANYRRTRVNSVSASTNGGLVVPGLYSLSNSLAPITAPAESETVVGVNGYFARANFSYKQMLYLDLTGRQDYASTLPAASNSYFYPSASLSFVFSELMNTSGAFTFGKLRLNYAQVGNLAPALALQDIFLLGTPFNGVPIASAPNTKNNPNLRSERTVNYEAGLELNFFENAMGLDLSVYQAQTFDQILPVRVTGATGQLFQYVNAGETKNRGIEVAFRVTPIKTADFAWDMNINWAKNVNEVVSLFGDQTNLQISSQFFTTIDATVGQPYGTIRGEGFVVDSTSGAYVVSANNWGGVRLAATDAPDQILGTFQPDWRGGFKNTLRYKGFTFSFLLDMQKGGSFVSEDAMFGLATGLYDVTAGNNANGQPIRGDLEGVNGGGFTWADMQAIFPHLEGKSIVNADGSEVTENFYGGNFYTAAGYARAPIAQFVFDASFVKLREISLTYQVPSSVLANTPINGVDLSLIGRNLAILYKNTLYTDPEAIMSSGNRQGMQNGAYPMVRELGFNIGVRF